MRSRVPLYADVNSLLNPAYLSSDFFTRAMLGIGAVFAVEWCYGSVRVHLSIRHDPVIIAAKQLHIAYRNSFNAWLCVHGATPASAGTLLCPARFTGRPLEQFASGQQFVSQPVQRAAKDVSLRSWRITNTIERCRDVLWSWRRL